MQGNRGEIEIPNEEKLAIFINNLIATGTAVFHVHYDSIKDIYIVAFDGGY